MEGRKECLTTPQHVMEGRKEMFHLTTHSTHFIYCYMASHIIMVKDHSDIERGNPLPPHGLLFLIGQDNAPRHLLHQSWSTDEREIDQWVYHEGSIL